jgi:hypothetical protein
MRPGYRVTARFHVNYGFLLALASLIMCGWNTPEDSLDPALSSPTMVQRTPCQSSEWYPRPPLPPLEHRLTDRTSHLESTLVKTAPAMSPRVRGMAALSDGLPRT